MIIELVTWDIITGKKIKTTVLNEKDKNNKMKRHEFKPYIRFNKERKDGQGGDCDPNISGMNKYHLLVKRKPEQENARRMNAHF